MPQDIESEGVEVEAPRETIERLETALPLKGEGKPKMKMRTRLGDLTIEDHYSLSNPSSHVAFADNEAMILVDNLEQTTLEKKKDSNLIVVKQASVASPGIMLLRLAYTLVAFMVAGFVFVFCIQIALFLFLGLAIESGLTSNNTENYFTFIGTLLSIPVFIGGLSQVMTIAQTFVIDTWRGSKFMKTVLSWESTLVDWVTFLVFFGIPIIVCSISLCTGTKEFWTITSITWFVLVLLYYAVFGLSALYYEIDGCLELVRYHPTLRDDNDHNDTEHSVMTFYRAIKLRLMQRMSGYVTVSYTAQGTDPHPDNLTLEDILKKESCKSFTGLYSRLSVSPCMCKLFTVLDKPVRQHNVDGVMEFTPYVTNASWGLESIYCRNRNTRFMAIIDGEAALTKKQVTSSIICFVFGTAMTLFAIVSFLVWFGAPANAVMFVTIAYVIFTYSSVRSSVGLNSTYKSVFNNDNQMNNEVKSNALYQVKETFRISEPRPEIYWITLVLELFLFVVIPLAALFAAGNPRVGIVFVGLSLFAVIRNVCNAPACLRELGSLEGIEINNKDKSARGEWREKHRLGKILGEISVGKRSRFWVGVFIFFVFAFCAIFISAVMLGSDDGASEPMKFANKDNFVYKGSAGVNYASCSMTKNIQSPDGIENSLTDFAFLATVAYLDDRAASDALSDWFDTTAINRADLAGDFQDTYRREKGHSAVSYKLFEFPDNNLRIVSIRGTSNAWDALSDAQLWSSAFLVQLLRAIVPLGGLWTSVFPHLVKAVSVIEDKALEDVSYYKETSSFIEDLKKDEDMKVQVVGHSLGGGLAMISGAQTKVPSVALSGPNNVISRRTFNPPLSMEDLDTFTFNIVPDRDPVPRIDDLAENYQRIQCRSAPNKPVDCHFGLRSLCEILYTCGSESRPIPCACVYEYGYPEPTSLNGGIFSQVCLEA